jgi:cytochrome c oxidase subunit I+III
MRLPGPAWSPVLAAAFTAAFFLILTVKFVTVALICGVFAVVSIIAWLWQLDPPPAGKVDVGGDTVLPTYVSGQLSHSWWAMLVLLLVAGALYLSFVFSYLYIWTVSPDAFAVVDLLPAGTMPAVSAALLISSSGLIALAGRLLSARTSDIVWSALMLLATAAIVGGLVNDVLAFWHAGLRPTSSVHGALVTLNSFLQFQLTATLVVMSGFAIARRMTGQLNSTRRVVFDNVALLWHYTVGQSLFGLLLIHGFPRAI